MTESLEIGIRYLLTELLADALIVIRHLKSARTVAAALLKTLFNRCDDVLILV